MPRTLERLEAEREYGDVVLVVLAQAEAGVVGRDVADALVVMRHAVLLIPVDLRMARKVLEHEAAAHATGEADHSPQREDLCGGKAAQELSNRQL